MKNNSPTDPDSIQHSWDEHNLSQLRYFRSLSLREKLQAVEGMADVVRRFQQIRVQGGFKTPAQVAEAHPTYSTNVDKPTSDDAAEKGAQ